MRWTKARLTQSGGAPCATLSAKSTVAGDLHSNRALEATRLASSVFAKASVSSKDADQLSNKSKEALFLARIWPNERLKMPGILLGSTSAKGSCLEKLKKLGEQRVALAQNQVGEQRALAWETHAR